MARIAGINIPVHKHASIALTAIFGIGRQRALAICKEAKISPSAKIKDLTARLKKAESELKAAIKKDEMQKKLADKNTKKITTKKPSKKLLTNGEDCIPSKEPGFFQSLYQSPFNRILISRFFQNILSNPLSFRILYISHSLPSLPI